MFDIGFSELIVIGVVALVVIGPERLPGVARTVGHLLGRFQRYVGDVKSDIQREMQLDELRKIQRDIEQQARALETSVTKEVSAVSAAVSAPLESLQQSVEQSLTTVGDAAATGATTTAAAPDVVHIEDATATPAARPPKPQEGQA